MGKKSDESQNLVDEKTDDPLASSNIPSSRKKRREKSNKSQNDKEGETTTRQKLQPGVEKEGKGDVQESGEIDFEAQKKRRRDKRRRKEKELVNKQEQTEDQGVVGLKDDTNVPKKSSQSRRPKTSKSESDRRSHKTHKLTDSRVDLRDNQEEKDVKVSSENIRKESHSSRASKKPSSKKKHQTKPTLSEDDDEETIRSNVNILPSRDLPVNEPDEEGLEESTKTKKSRKNKEKSPRLKDKDKITERQPKQSSQGKRSKSSKGKESDSKQGSKQSLRGVSNPVYEEDGYDEYPEESNVYHPALYGLDDDVLDSPSEEEGDIESDDEGMAYRLPPSASPIDLSPNSPYLLQPHFVSASGNPGTFSEPVNQIYREKVPGRFSKTSQKKISSINKFANNQVEPQSTKPTMTPLDLGLECQKVFRAVGVFSHGFLAGMAFWQLLMVYILSQEGLLHDIFFFLIVA